ncbi:activating signal cointegrator 1 complex subunit 3 [Morone saxatilis]|uniref:activating signal cointegrator 1 complex subunit 3 n=1 Tax=Morone saxatilis TaxID=34816 RepID=UPI0015E229AD|nr:activating signal cointegrator 1 complex subunit 3 [Morone saxatilis]
MSPPRLTGALRSFSTVSKKEDFTEQLSDLKTKRLKRRELFAREGLTWQKIVHFCNEHQDKAKQQAASQELKSLLLAAKQIVGTEHGQEAIESAAIFLFETFHNKDHVGTEETRAIKQMFGPFPSSAAEASCSCVAQLVASLGESRVEDFVQTQSSRHNPQRGSTFGRNIAFSYDCYTLEPLEDLPCSGIHEEKVSLDFINFLNNQQSGRKMGADVSSSERSVSSGDGTILRGEVEKYLNGGNMISSSPEELCTSLFEMLASHKSDDELQNELFELLGPEGLEMISTLLQQRAAIVDSLLAIPPDRTGYPSDVSRKVGGEVSKPTYGCQVTIHSEQEKQMMKMYRRGEKRERKRGKGTDDSDSSDAVMPFDPKEMRAQREQALLTARREPVFSRERVYERIRYPNVYDSYEEATKSPAFVGGARIGQLVFKGMKRLNRIQSLVFETAYNTNENLLICAPTGAGKTNIAMLTVLHEIRQHLQPGGVIKKDEFKIVYVAPMKALAAEMTNYFSKRLEPLGIAVKELTGDMQLTKGEILRTQMLVTTPEKWDVVTRKSVGDVALSQIVRLLILDEVHLLHEDRGPVLESLVARTIRQVESTQSMIRILGLSATLPNYLDVAAFLHVNPYIGLFFFDSRFRPVPLGQTFVGIKTTNKIQQLHDMEEVCYNKVLEQVKAGHQVMVFVHARNATVRTAMGLIEMAKNHGEISFFQPDQGPDYGQCEKQIQRSRNKQMKEMFPEGFGIHHAGMLRSDRSLMESMFSKGYLKVLVCTATLAWGVNLPAHAVIIKGTQIYDAKRGTLVDLGILDVMQIFGRAGRPQFDKYGEGTIITTHDKLSHYLTLLTQQNPIESQFLDSLADNLNAEVRDEELEELDQMLCNYCELPAAGGVENSYGKINILLQTYISRGEVDSFSLISDLSYVAQNAARIIRALFEIALRKRWPAMTYRLLTLCKVIDKRLWGFAHPLRQFPNLSHVVLNRLEEKKLTVDKLKEMRKDEIGHMLHHVNVGLTVKQCVHQIPSITMEASIQPITRTVLRVRLIVTPDFRWNDQVHGSVGEPWWLWVEDPINDHIYHSEYLLLQKKQVVTGEPQHIVFTIPIFEPLPSQYYIKAVSDRWLGAEAVCIINFQNLILPERHPPHTELLDLQPLPVTALANREYECLYKFTHFNPIQTQIFHTLYHTDTNVLLGAPTGSGKTIAAEMAMFRVFNKYPTSKVVYIAPLKALVRERIEDWKIRIEEKLGKKVVELTGDVTPDMRAIAQADLIVTTPEKWDGVSRSWQNRSYVQKVAILIIDEIHLLGEDRGPVLEVLVSRTNFISSHTSKSVRVVGLSTALANARDLADWLGIGQIEDIIATVRDSNLKLTLAFGIGMHHAGLHERDRKTVEELFVNCKIQVLIATSTLAWGVNFPAHLVVVKGTEYYDGKSRRYVDYPITDVLQMMGRAGRPQFDDQGKAVILVHDIKKDFYKKFLYEPFPVESSLLDVLSDHLNAEIAAGTIASKQDAMDYITWTYFFRRLVMNPSYYSLEDISHESINKYLSNLVERSLRDLECSYCIEIKEDDLTIEPMTYGRIASYYYLKHQTVRMFKERLKPDLPIHELLSILSEAEEYAELPVRHNEDQLNSQLAQQLPLQVNPHSYDSAHTKTHLLLQAHFSHAQLPCSDYNTDTKTVLDNTIRICQAMLDVAANEGWLVTAISICNLVQMIVQGRWLHDSSLQTLPHVEQQDLYLFRKWANRKGRSDAGGFNGPIEGLPELIAACNGKENVFASIVGQEFHSSQVAQAWSFLSHLPVLEVEMSVKGWWEDSQEQTERRLPAAGANLREERRWLDVHSDQEYVLQVSLRRINLGQQRRKQDSKAQAPRFPKTKDEGWFLVMGEVDRRELLAVKRVGYVRNHTAVSVAFYTPEKTGKCIYTLYLMSDSYLGLDQQYDIHLNVTSASIAAQVNTEVSDSVTELSLS